MTTEPEAEYAFVCAECWTRHKGKHAPLAVPAEYRERVPCALCGFVTDSGIVTTPAHVESWHEDDATRERPVCDA